MCTRVADLPFALTLNETEPLYIERQEIFRYYSLSGNWCPVAVDEQTIYFLPLGAPIRIDKSTKSATFLHDGVSWNVTAVNIDSEHQSITIFLSRPRASPLQLVFSLH